MSGEAIVKPPLGLVPAWLFYGQRLVEVLAAIDRYETAGMDVPAEWLVERDWLNSHACCLTRHLH